MPGERTPEQNLLIELQTTEDLALRLTEASLGLSTIEVRVEDCRHPFLHCLPQELKGFSPDDNPANSIFSVDLGLNYDKAELLFKPKTVGINLDNGYRFDLAQIPYQKKDDPEVRKRFIMDIVNPEGKSILQDGEQPLVEPSLVTELLNEIGIALPVDPQRATWEAIEAILQFSGRWSAYAEHAIPLDIQTQLRVQERHDGVGMSFNTSTPSNSVDSEDAAIREVVIGIEETDFTTGHPASSLQMLLRADSLEDKPRFAGLQRVPVEYATDYIGDTPYRVEQTEKAQSILPDTGLLGRIQEMILKAGEAVDAWNITAEQL